MSTETTNKKIKIDNGTTFGKTYTDKAIDAKLPTDLIASANKLSLGAGNSVLGNGVNLDGFTYDETTKTLKASGGGGGFNKYKIVQEEAAVEGPSGEHTYTIGEQVGMINHTLTPPSDFNDGIVVLLGTSCYSKNVVSGPVGKLEAEGDAIHFVVSAKLTKLNTGEYYLGARAQTINAGTATMKPFFEPFSITYAWIYK